MLIILKRALNRIKNYLEVGMSFHGLIPMPWEVEEIDDIVNEIKTLTSKAVISLNKYCIKEPTRKCEEF